MDKLNKKLIKIHKKLSDNKLDLKSKDYALFQDKLHLYLDSPVHDTSKVEQHIIASFWKNAYKNYKDGGYITNDDYTAKVRFSYEMKKIQKLIQTNTKDKTRALDIGCGNGRYAREFAKMFDEVVAIDLSKKQIRHNKKNNTLTNLTYLYENFITMPKNELGSFDFVFVGDIFMYTNDKEVEKTFLALLKLLGDSGILLVRESTQIVGFSSWKSKNYVAYYRNVDFYKNGVFSRYFLEKQRNYAYHLYYLNKYFHTFPKMKKKVQKNPLLLEKIVKEFSDIYTKSSHFFLYKKG